MPSEVVHEEPVSVSIVIPRPFNQTDEYSDTDSFNSDFECSEEETKPQTFGVTQPKPNHSEIDTSGSSTEEEEDGSHVNAKQIFKESLLQLEENITWDAVTEEFKQLRSQWRQRVREENSSGEAARLLIEFSTYLRPEALYDAEYIADDWTVQTASPDMTYNTLCGMLLALEESLNDDEDLKTFSASWCDSVNSWRENLDEAECGADGYDSEEYYTNSERANYLFYNDI